MYAEHLVVVEGISYGEDRNAQSPHHAREALFACVQPCRDRAFLK